MKGSGKFKENAATYYQLPWGKPYLLYVAKFEENRMVGCS